MSLTLKVDPSGRLVVQLYLGVGSVLRAALARAGHHPPRPVQVKALVDTGASRTVVEESKLTALGLTPTGEKDVHTASTGKNPVKRNLYKVEVSLAEAVTGKLADNLEVAAVDDLSGLGVEALLGRDVLRTIHFQYNGPNGEFTLDFP